MVSGVYLQLRDGMMKHYINVPLSTSLKGWTVRWFYISNPDPSTPGDMDHFVMSNPNWSAKPSIDEMSQVEELMKILKKIRLDGVRVAISFICRRIQLNKERVNPVYGYAGDGDITREAPEKLDKGDAYARAQKLFSFDTKLIDLGQQRAYSLANPPPAVMTQLLQPLLLQIV